MVDGGYDVELELSIGCRLENPRINLYLLYTWPVEFFEGRNDTGLLSRARWSIYEQMREVTALSLGVISLQSVEDRNDLITSDRRRSERSLWYVN